jgi:sugar phosphate isomerase/epimerase
MNPLREERLVLCNATLIGGAMETDLATLTSIVEASASAGFTGVSLWAFHHLAAVAGGASPAEVKAIHTDAGISAPVVEALLGWDGGDPTAIDAACLETLDVGAFYGSETAAAIVMAPELASFDAAAEGLAHLAERAAERGLKICVEWLPWSGIPTIADAWKLVQASGREDVGLVVDTWHWLRQPGGPDLDTLRSIPGDRIHVLQINDTTAIGDDDLFAECMAKRMLPGDGEVEFAPLLAALDEIGADPIWGPEVFNTELMALGPDAMAKRLAEASRKLGSGNAG